MGNWLLRISGARIYGALTISERHAAQSCLESLPKPKSALFKILKPANYPQYRRDRSYVPRGKMLQHPPYLELRM